MKTAIVCAHSQDGLERAVQLLLAGELVALPTETVYGLAADALNPQAVEKIFTAKGRPQDNPLIVHVDSVNLWRTLVETLPEAALRLAEAFWPGPLTIVLKKSALVPTVTSAGLDTVAVRMPDHPQTLELIRRTGRPLAAPSANLSGSPSPTTASHCADDLWGKVPLILDGGSCSVGIESTVISLVDAPLLLRPGKITAQQISTLLGEMVRVSPAVCSPMAEGEQPASPGMKYKHYAPLARLVLLEGTLEAFFNELERAPDGTFGLVFNGEANQTNHPCVTYGEEHDPHSQAKGLFAALRQLDELGATQIYARCPDKDDAALGVYNRMLRAAAFAVKQL